MHLFILFIGIFIDKIYANSNFNSDYPNVTFCVVSDNHPYKTKDSIYIYLKRQLGLEKNCTHIRGSLLIHDLHRLSNGADPDLSFLESIVEISGVLEIRENFIKRIPLGNLRIIRGITNSAAKYSLAISHNTGNETHHLEEVDLHNLRVIMAKDIRINNNYGLDYLAKKVNWSQIVSSPLSQNINIRDPLNQKNINYQCHANCTRSSNDNQFCFGPKESQCQKRSKCETSSYDIWCNFVEGIEIPCDSQCVGGCSGRTSSSCVACNDVYKKDKCVSSCAPQQSNRFGESDTKVKNDKLIYTAGGLCTSQCPDSLLDQDKVCVYKCDFSNYYKSGNRCLECPNKKCYDQIGDQLTCDLQKLDPKYPKDQRKYSLNKETLLKLTNCTIIVGQFCIDDKSFIDNKVTLPLLYKHLKNVREIMGEVLIQLFRTDVKSLSFLSNLKEIRGIAPQSATMPGLKVFVSSIEYLGLKKLEKVYGIVNFNHKSKLCYENTIPWQEITIDETSTPRCDKKCHPLCTRGCWGPGNELCYKCTFMEAGEYCVENCEDAPGYYTWTDQLNATKTECHKCHPFCKGNCTGPSSRDCKECHKAKENGTCVSSCSERYYPVSSSVIEQITCMRCHDLCYFGEMLRTHNLSSACSGPSKIIGSGGCSMCDKIITRDNISSCHKGKCPRGFFKDFNVLSVQQTSCNVCHPYCEECSGNDTHRRLCTKCKKHWYNDNCVAMCPEKIVNVTKISAGDECPRCHAQCQGGCHTENNSRTCFHCAHKKVYHNLLRTEYSCVTHCPMEMTYGEIIDEDFVCLSYEESMHYRQSKRILFIVFGCLVFLIITVLSIVFFFRYKFKQSKIKTDLKAFYSNFNEPNMKNLGADHINRPPNMNRLQMIPIIDLMFDTNSKPLGAGAFGKVYRGYWKVPGPDGKMYLLDVVVKVMHNGSKSSTNEFLDEAQIMASVSHRHCLPLIGVCLSLEKPCLVSTFAEFGSLDKYLIQYSATISSFSLIKYSEQIADGMAYLNMRGIIHRDLAARNILVTNKNIVQITDFGLARLVDDIDDGIIVRSGRVPIRWLALETLLYSNYSTASDIWAYGVTIWEIFTFGKRPYKELDTIKVKIYLQEGNRLPQPDICTLEVYMVMIKCWLEDPQMRPSFCELMSTFELFSHNSQRYLCIPNEHKDEYSYDTSKEAICLNLISVDSERKDMPLSNNKSGDNFSNHTSHNDSDYPLISASCCKYDEEDHAILPMRKKAKRNISFDKFKIFPKINFTKLKANKSTVPKVIQYCQSHNDYIKNSCLSYDSTSGLISSQRSSEYEGQPLNPQIAKLMMHDNWQPARDSKNVNKHHSILSSDRVFHDEVLKEDIKASSKPLEECFINKSQKLPPINIQKLDSRALSIEHPLIDLNIRPITNSPDSGHSRDSEIV